MPVAGRLPTIWNSSQALYYPARPTHSTFFAQIVGDEQKANSSSRRCVPCNVNACIEKSDKEPSFLDPADTNLCPNLEGSCQEQSSPPGQPWREPGSGEPVMAPQSLPVEWVKGETQQLLATSAVTKLCVPQVLRRGNLITVSGSVVTCHDAVDPMVTLELKHWSKPCQAVVILKWRRMPHTFTAGTVVECIPGWAHFEQTCYLHRP